MVHLKCLPHKILCTTVMFRFPSHYKSNQFSVLKAPINMIIQVEAKTDQPIEKQLHAICDR